MCADGDPDIDTLPFLAWSRKLAGKVLRGKENTAFARFCVKYQHIVYFPLLLLARMTWVMQSFTLVFGIDTYWSVIARNKTESGEVTGVDVAKIKLRYPWLQPAVVIAHHTWYFAFLLFGGMPWATALAFFFLNQMFTGFCMALAFGVGHNGMLVHDADVKPGFFELQVTTTRDVIDSFPIGWFMGGLHYQIEHHLFPTMSRFNLSQTAPYVKVRVVLQRAGRGRGLVCCGHI